MALICVIALYFMPYWRPLKIRLQSVIREPKSENLWFVL